MQEFRRRFVRRLERIPPAVWVAFVLLVGAGCWWDAHRRVPWDIQVLDAMEYADIGRHLARGEGFTTSLIYPAEVEFGVGHEHPSLVRPPVWPLLLAAGFALGGEHGAVAQVLLGAVHLASIAAALALALLHAPPTQSPRVAPEPWATCVKAGDLVLAEDASRIVWDTGAVTIWVAAGNADFWTILERYPVDYVLITSRRDLLTRRFQREFEAPPECGGALYRRRTPARE